jgi:hypothetical protein
MAETKMAKLETNPTANDEAIARQLQDAELGQSNGPVVLGVPTRLANLPVVAALVTDLPVEEIVVLNYSKAVLMFALIDIFFTLINAIAVLAELRDRDNQYRDMAWPTNLTLGFVCLACLSMPIAGAIGARMLNYSLTAVYMVFCLLKLSGHIFFGAFMSLWYILFVFVEFWICRITGQFLLALGRVDPSRRKELRTIDAKDAVRMVYW